MFEHVRAFASSGVGGRPDYAFCGQVSANGAASASFYSEGSAVVLEDADPIGYARVAETYGVGEPRAVRFSSASGKLRGSAACKPPSRRPARGALGVGATRSLAQTGTAPDRSALRGLSCSSQGPMVRRGGAPETDVLEDRKIWIVLAMIVAILVWWQWPELQDAAKMFGVERR